MQWLDVDRPKGDIQGAQARRRYRARGFWRAPTRQCANRDAARVRRQSWLRSHSIRRRGCRIPDTARRIPRFRPPPAPPRWGERQWRRDCDRRLCGMRRAKQRLVQSTSGAAERKLLRRRCKSKRRSPMPSSASSKKCPDLRLAKSVDGLHRIAHAKYAAAIALLPSGRQQPHQLQLRAGCILKFVDENVLQPVIETQAQIRRRVRAAERAQRRNRYRRKIHGTLLAKDAVQFSRRQHQHLRHFAHPLPRSVAVARIRQRAQFDKAIENARIFGEFLQQGSASVLCRRCPAESPASW